MKEITIDNIQYTWNLNDSFVDKQWKTHRFASLGKVKKYKNRNVYQKITIKPEHLDEFYKFLSKILAEEGDF